MNSDLLNLFSGTQSADAAASGMGANAKRSGSASAGFGSMLQSLMNRSAEPDLAAPSASAITVRSAATADASTVNNVRQTLFPQGQSVRDQEAMRRVTALVKSGAIKTEDIQKLSNEEWGELKTFVLDGAGGLFEPVAFSEDDCEGLEVTLELMQAMLQTLPQTMPLADVAGEALEQLEATLPASAAWSQQSNDALEELAQLMQRMDEAAAENAPKPGDGFIRALQQQAVTDAQALPDDPAGDAVQQMAVADQTPVDTEMVEILAKSGRTAQATAQEEAPITLADVFTAAGVELDEATEAKLKNIPADVLQSFKAETKGKTDGMLSALLRQGKNAGMAAEPEQALETELLPELELSGEEVDALIDWADALPEAAAGPVVLDFDTPDGDTAAITDDMKIHDSRGADARLEQMQRAEQSVQVQDSRVIENIEKVEQALRTAVRRNLSEVTLQLSPPELGKVTMHLEVQNGTLSATLRAENADAKHYLTTGLDQLRQNLQSVGIELDKFDVGVDTRDSNQNGQEAPRQPRRRGSREAGGNDVAGLESVSSMTRTAGASAFGSGGVNIVA